MCAPKRFLTAAAVVAAITTTTFSANAESVARIWNEQNLAAIRVDFPNPPVHARNLFHTSAAMWDAWAAYDPTATGYAHREDASASDLAAARHEAISYAAYRVLESRYARSVNSSESLQAFRTQMEALGYDPDYRSQLGVRPANVGNRCGAAILAFADSDGSNESNDYRDFTYRPVNSPHILGSSTLQISNPNRWQPLAFDVAVTQNGLIATDVQKFIAPHWGDVRPFGMSRPDASDIYYDPGAPPQVGMGDDAAYKDGNVKVIEASAALDPNHTKLIDISPASRGNSTLGNDDGTGHQTNPATSAPYEKSFVREGDYGRVLAEFWADGPDSETPPGHWNTLANEVGEHPSFERRYRGEGAPLDPLEWDVKLYFALNAATHDAAVAAWGCKRKYDYVRPVTSIQYLAQLGQSSDPSLPSYSPSGIPLVEGLIEVVTEETAQPGQRHASMPIGEIALFAWGGEPFDPETEAKGSQWILASDWLPYQRDTFVTPAFAGYVSGHSTFSRAAAEVLTAMTGSPYFPGGLGTFTAKKDEFLKFENGPSTDITLQWATYYDAADEAGLSRIYGGIHVPADDGPGRIMGSECGQTAWQLATRYFDGSILDEPLTIDISVGSPSDIRLIWPSIRGMRYRLEAGDDLANMFPIEFGLQADDVFFQWDVPRDQSMRFFRVRRQ